MNEGLGKPNVEGKLSPEQIEKIMAKVQDINLEGIGFHAIGAEDYDADPKTIFANGLLGVSDRKREEDDTSPKKWAKNARNKKGGVVHFNITGRFSDGDREGALKSAHFSKRRVSILFDLGAFQEQDFFGEIGTHQYRTNNPILSRDRIDYKNRPLPSSVWGFILKHRIAPRFFRGLVLAHDQDYYDGRGEDEKIKGATYLAEDLRKYLELMNSVYSKTPEKSLPIYDLNGNLLWPKQMSYEEVKKFMAERSDKSGKV